MKPFLLLICAGVLCLSVTAESPNSQPQKRQIPDPGPPDVNTQCRNVYRARQCTSGHDQDYADLYYQCGFIQIANGTESSCRTNGDGQFCGQFGLSRFQDLYRAVCSGGDCSDNPDCQGVLRSMKSELGCCLNVFNDSNSGLYSQSTSNTLFSYSLWSQCGIEPVGEECTASPVEIERTRDLSCTQTVLLSRLYTEAFCNRRYVESNLEALNEEEICRNYTDYNPNHACGFNEFGEYCTLIDDLQDQLYSARANCQSTDTCNPVCVETLRNVTNRVGCCINNNNQTGGGGDHLSYEFWSRCGLVSPGFCQPRFTDRRPIEPPATPDPNPATRATDSNNHSTAVTPGAISVLLTAALFLLLQLF